MKKFQTFLICRLKHHKKYNFIVKGIGKNGKLIIRDVVSRICSEAKIRFLEFRTIKYDPDNIFDAYFTNVLL